MAKQAPKGKETAAKPTEKKAEKPVAAKAAKAPVKPAAAKAAKPPVKAAQAAGKVAVKKAPAKGSKKKVSRGDRYSCEVCGLVVSVDEACGCAETCDIVCCGKEMKAKK